MKAYKFNTDYSEYYAKHVIMIYINNYCMRLATPTTPQLYPMHKSLLDSFIKMGIVDEINLEDETWIHPHLYKPIKDIIVPT